MARCGDFYLLGSGGVNFVDHLPSVYKLGSTTTMQHIY
jgi:hypothetical protein